VRDHSALGVDGFTQRRILQRERIVDGLGGTVGEAEEEEEEEGFL
jgi:hypothetical protein